jgi:heat shock protein HslJ
MLCAVSVLAVSACGDDEASGVDEDDLNGRVFTSTGVDGTTIVDGTNVVITFADDSMSVIAGCNTMNGGFDIEDDVLEAANLVSTMMACDEGLMAQDQWVTALLTGSPTVALDGDTLTIAGGDITLTLDGA